MCAWRHGCADLLKVSLQGGCVAPGHYQPRALAPRWADSAEDVGRDRALVVGRPWTRAAPGPSPGQLVLLPDAGFILEPNFDLDVRADPLLDRYEFGGEVFLNVSIASASWA